MNETPRWIDPGQYSQPDLVSAFDDLCLWAAPFGLSLLDTVRMRGVSAALDIGCGPGFPLIELADRLGPASRVVGIDPWEAALDRARQKATLRGLSNVEIVVGKAEDLPFPDSTFDLIVSNNGLNNVADPQRALRECARTSRPGAQLVITANLPESMRELYDVYEAVLRDRGRADLLPRVAAHIDHKRKPAGVLQAWIEAAGFRDVRAHEHAFRMRFTGGKALFRHWFMRLGFIESWASVLPEAEVTPVFGEIERRLDARAAALGDVTLTVPFVCIEAVRA